MGTVAAIALLVGLAPLGQLPAAASGHDVSPPAVVSRFNTATPTTVGASGAFALSGYSAVDPIRVTVEATNGDVRVTTTTGLTLAPPYTTYGPAGTISFFGVLADVNTALASLQFRGNTAGVAASITVSASEGEGLVNPDNNHYYEFVEDVDTWSGARAAAASRSVPGCGGTCTGYLVTITSAAEQTFVNNRVNADTWIGLTDAFAEVNAATGSTHDDQSDTEGQFYWVTGPEAGTLVTIGNTTPVAQGGEYENWATGEPNNAGTEHFGQMYASNGLWNDLGGVNTQPSYVVEYGGDGNLPDAADSIAEETVSVTVADVPSAPTITSVTPGNGTISVAFTPPDYQGSGPITDYEISLDNGATWTSLGTASPTSPHVVSGLTSGETKSVRLRAVNEAGNGDASNMLSAVVGRGGSGDDDDDDEETPAHAPEEPEPAPDDPAPARPTRVRRVSGSDRVATAAQMATDYYRPGVPTVFVARDDDFPDALTGTPLAHLHDGPIMLVKTDHIPSAAVDALKLLQPGKIVVLGGPAAVSLAVERSLAAYAPVVERLRGANRFDTAVTISKRRFPGTATGVLIATGEAFPDALSIATAGTHADMSVLLTQGHELTAVTAGELRRLAPSRVVVVGGPGAVAERVLEQIAAITGVKPERLAGRSRFDTAAAVSKEFFAPNRRAVFVAGGATFADGLVAGPVAARMGGPVIITSNDGVPASVGRELGRLDPRNLIIVGGTSAVSTDTVDELKRALSGGA